MYCLPQEIEVWYIIPAVRSEIARCLISDYKLSYDRVAKILGVSKAAVSQYIKGKRAAKIKLPKELRPKLMRSCKMMIKNKTTSTEEIIRVIDYIRSKRLPCVVCEKLREGLPENCRELRFNGKNYA
ncbi:hypothetical protein D6817_05560 [Candidatus Pacearchaeota archaeon]|nr:MAG: hypothetical protein D6817_05560 [Candidatus Pacearchaeota archaeon]